MMWINAGFAFVVAVVSVFTIFSLGVQPASVLFLIIGLLCVGVTAYGLLKSRLMTVAAGSLAVTLLMPTRAGMIPMIIGFAFFILLLSLQLFIMLSAASEDGKGSVSKRKLK